MVVQPYLEHEEPEQRQDVLEESFATRYSILRKERQTSGGECDEEFGGYGSGDKRLKTVWACV